jgi:hypothetical protein
MTIKTPMVAPTSKPSAVMPIMSLMGSLPSTTPNTDAIPQALDVPDFRPGESAMSFERAFNDAATVDFADCENLPLMVVAELRIAPQTFLILVRNEFEAFLELLQKAAAGLVAGGNGCCQ